MADNITLPGTVLPVATDEIGGVHFERVKMAWGADGVANDASAATPLPVAIQSPVDINGTVPVSSAALTSLASSVQTEDTPHTTGAPGQLMLAVRWDSDTPTVDANGDYTVLKLDEAGRLKVASMPASYAATTGNIAANGQTVSMDCTRFSNVMIHCKGTFSTVNVTFEGSLDSTNGTDGTWFTVQAIRSNANTIETATGNLSAAPAYAWELSVNALKWFRVRATAWTSGTQVWTMIPGTYATEPIPGAQVTGAQAVTMTSTTVTACTPATPTPSNISSAATTNLTSVKASAGTVYSVSVSNTGAGAAYLKFYNKASAPVLASDVPVLTIAVPASGTVNVPFGAMGHRFATGIALAITGGAADTDATAVAAAQVKVLTSYI